MTTKIVKSLLVTLVFTLLVSGPSMPMFEGPGPAPLPPNGLAAR